MIKYSKQISESKHETWNKLQGLIPLDLRFLRLLMILDLLYFSGYEVKIHESKGYPQPVMATQNRHLNDYIYSYCNVLLIHLLTAFEGNMRFNSPSNQTVAYNRSNGSTEANHFAQEPCL